MIMDTSIATPVSYLRDEFERQQALFNAQPAIVQRFLETQAQRLADALVNGAHQARFSLPDRVVDKTPHSGDMAAMLIPNEIREQTLGAGRMFFERRPLHESLRRRFSELEQSPDQAVHAGANLLRHALATHMVCNMLPDGRSVTYCADEGEQIPTIPVKVKGQAGSAITSAADAVVEQGPLEAGRGEYHVPFIPAARRFFLPQWVAFGDGGEMLVNSPGEAEAHLASMERYIEILHAASSFAPYMVASSVYQRKRYGMLGQLVNQGRALARYKTGQIISAILERVEKGTLNRGLSINLPFYDDQELRMDQLAMTAIPAGRIAFKPIFIVRAARMESAKVGQDTRLNPSTRKYLLRELELLEQTFLNRPNYR